MYLSLCFFHHCVFQHFIGLGLIYPWFRGKILVICHVFEERAVFLQRNKVHLYANFFQKADFQICVILAFTLKVGII